MRYRFCAKKYHPKKMIRRLIMFSLLLLTEAKIDIKNLYRVLVYRLKIIYITTPDALTDGDDRASFG